MVLVTLVIQTIRDLWDPHPIEKQMILVEEECSISQTDGNFRVGGLFNVEQATGIATLNVEAFNIRLNELQLGSVALGGAGAVITESRTDGTFSADSDSIAPTQKAIKTYIHQIGGVVH